MGELILPQKDWVTMKGSLQREVEYRGWFALYDNRGTEQDIARKYKV